jgi:uncharacterized small protein (DUF1192 family)
MRVGAGAISKLKQKSKRGRAMNEAMLTARKLVEEHISAYGYIPHPDKIKDAVAAEIARLRAALDVANQGLAAWVDMAYERGLGDPEECAHQLDADGKQIARLRTVISKWQETAVKLGFDGVDMAIDLGAEITRLRANLEQTNATLVAANRECDRRGQELAAARQNAENREAWIETLNKSYAINMKIVSEARDAARHDADRLRTALTIIADWDRAPITGEWRESLLDIIRSICDCARTALMN